MHVARADHFDLFGNAVAGFEDCLHGACRGRIVVPENRVGDGIEQEQSPRRLVAGGVVGGPLHIFFDGIQAGGSECFPIPFEPAHAGGVPRSGDVRDAAAAAFDQVLGRQPANRFIVGPHVGRVHARDSAVHQHIRHAARFDPREYVFRIRRLGRRQNEPIHLTRQQAVDFAGLQARIFFGIADHHVVTQRPHGAGYTFGDLGKERMHQVRHHQAYHECAPRRQAARHPVGLVVEFLDTGEHPATGFGTDIGAAPDNFRYGHNRDVQVPGYVLQTHWRTWRIRHKRTGGPMGITRKPDLMMPHFRPALKALRNSRRVLRVLRRGVAP